MAIDNITRVAIYARVSTDKQDTENQAVQLREFARRQGWQVVREYVDYESGAKADRAEFRQMFEDASRRKFDLLLFWALDRLSREGGSGARQSGWQGSRAPGEAQRPAHCPGSPPARSGSFAASYRARARHL